MKNAVQALRDEVRNNNQLVDLLTVECADAKTKADALEPGTPDWSEQILKQHDLGMKINHIKSVNAGLLHAINVIEGEQHV